jgi:hypothetical protein
MIIAFVKSHLCNRKFGEKALSFQALNHTTEEILAKVYASEKINEMNEKIILGFDMISDNLVSLIQLYNQLNSKYSDVRMSSPDLNFLAKQLMFSFVNEFAKFEGQLLLIQDIAVEVCRFSQKVLSTCKVTCDKILNC